MAKNVWACLNSRQHFFCFSFSQYLLVSMPGKTWKNAVPKDNGFLSGKCPSRKCRSAQSNWNFTLHMIRTSGWSEILQEINQSFFFFAWTFFQSHIILLQVCLIQLVDVFISHISLTRQHRVADVGNYRSCNWRVLGRQGLDPHVVWCWMFFVRPIPRSS